jgi:hypothetical protein
LIIHDRHAPADEPVFVTVLDAATDELFHPEIYKTPGDLHSAFTSHIPSGFVGNGIPLHFNQQDPGRGPEIGGHPFFEQGNGDFCPDLFLGSASWHGIDLHRLSRALQSISEGSNLSIEITKQGGCQKPFLGAEKLLP